MANPFGIQWDNSGTHWNAGRINAIAELKASVLAASPSGGVWLITDGGEATPLSNDWDSPNINCLAVDSANSLHIYAGGFAQGGFNSLGALYVTDTSYTYPLQSPWAPIQLVGQGSTENIGYVFQIALDPAGYIVLATSNGLWWSKIPNTPGGSGYAWQRATGLPFPEGDFSSVIANNGVIIAAAHGADISRQHYGIFRGAWNGGALQMQRDTIQFSDQTTTETGMNTTILAARAPSPNASAPSAIYALSCDSTGMFYALLRYDATTVAWQQKSARLNATPPTNFRLDAGTQGNRQDGRTGNMCICVSPNADDTMAFGWVNGPYLSTNGGDDFQRVSLGVGGHQDLHALLITATDTGRFYAAGDGGIFMSPSLDSSAPVNTIYSRKLANMEFISPTGKPWWGVIGASKRTSGLVGAGTQDNDNLYCIAYHTGTASPWRRMNGGADDGGPMVILNSDGVVNYTNQVFPSYAPWGGGAYGSNRLIPVGVPSPTYTGGGIFGPIEGFASPAYIGRTGQFMFAVLGFGRDLYGLFADGDAATGPRSATNMQWVYLATVPVGQNVGISALGSANGRTILVGLSSGEIYVFDTATNGFSTSSSSGLTRTGTIVRIVVRDGTAQPEAFAIKNDSGGALYHTSHADIWTQIHADPDNTFNGLAVDWSATQPTAYLALDDGIYASQASRWFKVSNGLPRRPHCTDVRIVDDANGSRYLYATTFGRSMWFTHLA